MQYLILFAKFATYIMLFYFLYQSKSSDVYIAVPYYSMLLLYALMLVCRFAGILFCYRQNNDRSLPVDQHLHFLVVNNIK